MFRLTKIAIGVLLLGLLAAIATGAQAKLFFLPRGTQGVMDPLSIARVSISCGDSCAYTSGAPSGTVIGNLSATLSAGSFTGTWSTSGTAGAQFSANVGNQLKTNSSTPTCTTTTALSLNIVATQPGVTNPFSQNITVTCNPLPLITSASISCGSSCAYTSGMPSGTVIGNLSATLSSGSFTGTWSTSGTDGAKFSANVGNQLKTNGTTPTCTSTTTFNLNIVATQAGVSNSPFPQAITVTCSPSGSGGAAAPAIAAGFTTPIMNIDFTTVASNWPNTNVVPCSGASGSTPNQPSTWTFQLSTVGNGALPCDATHIAIVNDPVANGGNGLNALRFNYLNSDPCLSPPNAGDCYGNLAWPANAFVLNPPTPAWLPLAHFIVLKFRVANTPACPADMTFWATSGSGGTSTHVDENVGETNCTSNHFGGGYWEWTTPGCFNPPNTCGFPTALDVDMTFTQYNTLEILWTNDGSGRVGSCGWLNANGNYSSPGPYSCSSGAFINNVNYQIHDEVMYYALGVTEAPLYIQSYQVWTCPGGATSPTTMCAGPVVDHWPFP